MRALPTRFPSSSLRELKQTGQTRSSPPPPAFTRRRRRRRCAAEARRLCAASPGGHGRRARARGGRAPRRRLLRACARMGSRWPSSLAPFRLVGLDRRAAGAEALRLAPRVLERRPGVGVDELTRLDSLEPVPFQELRV